MSPLPPGAPRESPKPEPIGNSILLFLFTVGTLCLLFILWRRASALRRVVSHQLKTLRGQPSEGQIRLSIDDGPPANAFLHDEYDDDNPSLPVGPNDEPLSEHIRKVTQAWREPGLGLGIGNGGSTTSANGIGMSGNANGNGVGNVGVHANTSTMDLGTLSEVQGGFVASSENELRVLS